MILGKLEKPQEMYKDTYIDGVREYHSEGFLTNKLNVKILENNFGGYLQKIKDWEKGENLPETFSPQSEYWLIEDKEYVGTVKVRHRLSNKTLKLFGGHIGYFIRPSRRKMGYGTKILELVLPEAKKIGLDNVLITCDVSNGWSKKIIENNGGLFESIEKNSQGEDRSRFWIAQ